MYDDRWPDEAEELSAALAAILAKECTPEALREAESADGRIERLDSALSDFGLWDLPADPYLFVRAAVELGNHAAPVPFVSAGPAMALLGANDVADGVDRQVVTATLPRTAIAVSDAITIVATPTDRRLSSAGEAVALLPTPSAGEGDTTDIDPMVFRSWGLLLEAARLVGAAQSLLRYAVDYTSERKQFGQPVGAFQAVAHPLADAATDVDAADLLVRHATYLTATDGAPPLYSCAMAAQKAKRAARLMASTAHQALGGYGFTVEADCQLYSRRIRAWTTAMPDPGRWLTEMARRLADPTTRDSVKDLWQFDSGYSLPRWARGMAD
jgi:hypothetical protein